MTLPARAVTSVGKRASSGAEDGKTLEKTVVIDRMAIAGKNPQKEDGQARFGLVVADLTKDIALV
jgi:hypothetical protein